MAKLTIVPTPIGNLEDMTFRAIRSLKEADLILAEDTRTTGILLKHFEIQNKMLSHHKFNEHQTVERMAARVKGGENIALVSDAGMPAISDPGEMLVTQCAEKGIPVRVVPGPSAVVSALAISGLPTGRFTFEGFLSTAKKSRREHLAQVKQERRTMIFYEAPHKLLTTLEDMLEAWGDRRIAVVRELTKIHEEAIRTTLAQAVAFYRENTPKGEFVLVIEGAPEEQAEEMTLEQAVAFAREQMARGASASEAAKEAAQASPFKKGELYRLLMAEKEE